MPVKVKCTSCGLELQAPDDLVGKHATCPQCRTKLSVGNGSLTSSTFVAMKALPVPPPAPPGSPNRGSVQPSSEEIASYLEEPPVPAKGSSRESVSSLAQPGSGTVALPPRPPTASTQSARFIIADATARRIELGAGGQLPRLVLDEAQKKEVPEERASGSKTWILFAAVGASVVLSVGMLLVDVTGPRLERSDKSEAREKVTRKYVQKLAATEPRPPCQPILALAVQAYNRGDHAEERRLYRQVLDMLHSEGKDPYKGITGVVNTQDSAVANDIELEQLISTLLRE